MRLAMLALLAALAAAGDGAEASRALEAALEPDGPAHAALAAALMEVVDGHDPARRDAALGAIRRIGADALSEHLKAEPSAYTEVYRALARCGPQGQRALVGWLDRHHWPARTIQAIAECDAPVVVPLLLGKTEADNAFVRSYALAALSCFEVDRGRMAPVLRRCLADPAAQVRLCALGLAMSFLAVYRDDDFVPLLRQRLWEDDEEMCAGAAHALGVLGEHAAPAAADLAGIAKQGPARHAALEALYAIGPAAAPGARFALTAMLDDEEWRVVAARVLARVAPEERRALTVLVDNLAREDEWWMFNDEGTVALVEMGRAAAPELPRLRKMRESANPTVRLRAALVAVSASGDPHEGLPILLSFLEGDGDDEMGWMLVPAALDAIGRLGPAARGAAPRLRKLLEAMPPEQERMPVVRALWKVTGDARDVVPALRNELSPEYAFQSLEALELVREMGPTAAELLPLLKELEASPHEGVSIAAREAAEAVAK